ncbi:MAG: PQQ-binding-like beta-propeller repeat protein [Thermoplasmatales archaeon]|nr:MAG: PQQ-binding-like beta-propeller repeat protein [Thermoplasmatales archaeon]
MFIVSTVSPLVIGYEVDAIRKDSIKIELKPSKVSYNNDSAWPMYQHDAANTGFSSSPFPDSLNLSYNLSYSELTNDSFITMFSSLIVANGKIFITGPGFKTHIFALDENNGSLIWKTRLPLTYNMVAVNTPVVSNGKVFVCFGSLLTFPPLTVLFALDENTGEIIWEKNIMDSSFYPSITLSNDKVIVGGHFTFILPISRLYVFDANNGDLIWQNKMRGFFESTPVVSNNTVFTATSCKSPMTIGFNAPLFSGRARVYAFDLNDGSTIWKTRVKGHVIISSPAVSNGKLLVPSDIFKGNKCNRRITSLDVKTGEKLWHYHINQDALNSSWPTSISTPSVGYGKIFIIDVSGLIIALDEETGEMLWESEIIDEIEGQSWCSARPPVIADNKVITASTVDNNSLEINKICMFNVSNGEKIWSGEGPEFLSPIVPYPFAIANGKLFVNGGDSIYVYS